MTDMLTAPRHVPSATPASRSAGRWAVAGGVVAGPLFLVAGLAQGFARDGFDFTRNAISQLALGEWGWVQTVSFLLTGALLIVGAAGLRRALRGGPGGTWGRPWSVSSAFPSGPRRPSRPMPVRAFPSGHPRRP